MIKLTDRLNSVANLVHENSVLADVGCDHGYLPTFLVLNGKIKGAVASDINEGPLKSCAKIVKENNLEDKIKCVLSDGLKNISKDECTDVAICGMGGELIVKILKECSWSKDKDKHFIFNPMTHPEILREYLCKTGYELGKDIVVKEGNRYYNVFECHFTGNIKDVDESYYFLGNIDNFEYKDYFNHLINYLNNRMKSGNDYSNIINTIKEKI